MKYKTCNRKKGLIDDVVPFIILLFVAAVAIVFLKSTSEAKDSQSIDKIKLKKNLLEAHDVMLNYLEKIGENGNNRADLISQSYNREDYAELKKDMGAYFNSKLKLDYLPEWRIEAVGQNQKELFSLQSKWYSPKMDAIYQADSFFIPVKGTKSRLITLNIFLGS